MRALGLSRVAVIALVMTARAVARTGRVGRSLAGHAVLAERHALRGAYSGGALQRNRQDYREKDRQTEELARHAADHIKAAPGAT